MWLNVRESYWDRWNALTARRSSATVVRRVWWCELALCTFKPPAFCRWAKSRVQAAASEMPLGYRVDKLPTLCPPLKRADALRVPHQSTGQGQAHSRF